LADGDPLGTASAVSLQFTPTSVDLPPSTVLMASEAEGQYKADGGFLALADRWQVQVTVRRTDTFDTFANFDLNIGVSPGSSQGAQGIPWHRISGALLVAGSVVYLFAANGLVREKKRSYAYAVTPAIVLAAIGLVVFIDPFGDQSSELLNPIPPNADSLAIGQALYQENCLPCHGVSGAGDGPISQALNPPPADLTQHTAPGVHPDSRLYEWITNGVPNSVMPAFGDRLSDEQRWHLVNFIRTLASP
jgi:mono/diheme cytochrome c family protein